MFSLTVREQSLVAAILFAVVSGSVIHHYRHRTGADAPILGAKTVQLAIPADETFAP